MLQQHTWTIALDPEHFQVIAVLRLDTILLEFESMVLYRLLKRHFGGLNVKNMLTLGFKWVAETKIIQAMAHCLADVGVKGIKKFVGEEERRYQY